MAGGQSSRPRVRRSRYLFPRPAAGVRRSRQQAPGGAGGPLAGERRACDGRGFVAARDHPADHLAAGPRGRNCPADARARTGPGSSGAPPGRARVLERTAGRGPRPVLTARWHPRRVSRGRRRTRARGVGGRCNRDAPPVRPRKPALRDGRARGLDQDRSGAAARSGPRRGSGGPPPRSRFACQLARRRRFGVGGRARAARIRIRISRRRVLCRLSRPCAPVAAGSRAGRRGGAGFRSESTARGCPFGDRGSRDAGGRGIRGR